MRKIIKKSKPAPTDNRNLCAKTFITNIAAEVENERCEK
jgi:hypothetical protein